MGKVAFCGLGLMGTGMAKSLLRAGLDLAQVAEALGDLTLAQFDHASGLGFGAENESHVLDAVRDQSRRATSVDPTTN